MSSNVINHMVKKNTLKWVYTLQKSVIQILFIKKVAGEAKGKIYSIKYGMIVSNFNQLKRYTSPN